MADKILLRRGLYADLPNLDAGELGYVTDHGTLYLGTAGSDNIFINPVRVVVDGYEIDGYFKPSADNTFGLGTPDKRWKNISVGPGSVHIISRSTDAGFSKNKEFRLTVHPTSGQLQIMDNTNIVAAFDADGASFPMGIDGIVTALTLDGYARVPNTAATGDGYIAFFTGIGRNLAGDNDLLYNRATGNLTLGGSGTYRVAFAGAQANPSFNVGNSTGIFLDENNRLGLTIGGTQYWHISSLGTLSTTAGATIAAAQGNTTTVTYSSNLAGNTGIFFPGSNSTAIATSGSEAVRVVDSRVGIGITVPSASLHVAGDGYFDGYLMPFTEGLWGLGATQKRWHSLNLGKGGLYVQDSGNIFLGENISLGSRISPSSNLSQLVLGLGAQHNRHIIIGMSEFANRDYDKGSGDPTLYIHSVTNPDANNTEYLSLSHTTTKAKIFAGSGILNMGTDATSSHSLSTGDTVFGGQIEVNGNTWFDSAVTATSTLQLDNDVPLYIGPVGSGPGTHTLWRRTSQTNDGVMMGLATGARLFLIVQNGNEGTDYGHANPADPTLVIQSSNALSPTQWISLSHNQTAGVVATGAGYLSLGAFTGTGHSLTAGDVAVSGQLEVNGTFWSDASSVFAENSALWLGGPTGGTNSAIFPEATRGQLTFLLGSAHGYHMVLGASDVITQDFGHAAQTNPTIFVHSATNPSINANQYLSLAHNQTDGYIFAAQGSLKVSSASGLLATLNTSGPAIRDVASTTTVPTLIPNKTDLTAGLGGTAGDLSIITGNVERINFDTAGLITVNQSTRFIDFDALGGSGSTLELGTGNRDFAFAFLSSQTVDMAFMGGATTSRGLVFANTSTWATDFGHANPTNPTLWIQSSNDSDINQYLSLSHNQTDGYVTSGSGGLNFGPYFRTPVAGILLFAGQTTFAVTSNVMAVTADAGTNTIATITGGKSGMFLTLICRNAGLTITDDATGTPNTINISAAFASTAGDTLTLVHDGTSWYETSRAVN